MRRSLKLQATLLAGLFIVSSCATTKYSEDVTKNNFSNLEAGRPYSFGLKDSSKNLKMVYTRTKGDSILGYASKKDSTPVAVAKSNVISAKDIRKANTTIGAGVIGAAGVAALVISSSKATKND